MTLDNNYLLQQFYYLYLAYNCIGSVMDSVFASSAVDRGFEPQSSQTKDYEIVIVASPLSTQHKEREQRLVGSESG